MFRPIIPFFWNINILDARKYVRIDSWSPDHARSRRSSLWVLFTFLPLRLCDSAYTRSILGRFPGVPNDVSGLT